MASPTEVARMVRMTAALVRSLGGDVRAPALLMADNHLTVRFGDLVAKVRRAQAGSSDAQAMAREVAVARQLADLGAPVAPPSGAPPAGPHFHNGLAVTLWPHIDGRPLTDRDAHAAVRALRDVHAGLARYSGGLPHLTDAFDGCVRTLCDPELAPRLTPEDRTFLLAEHQRFRAQFDRFDFEAIALHGDVRLANALVTREGVVWLDFEAACVGPLERDLTQFRGQALKDVAPIDRSMLRLMRDYGAACVAVWCWADPQPTATVAEAAAFHLASLRRRAAQRRA